MGKRHHEDDDGQQQVQHDQVPVEMHVVIEENDRIDHRENGDQERHCVDDGKPTADGTGIARRAELGEAAKRTEPSEQWRIARRRDWFVLAHDPVSCRPAANSARRWY
jgi:hypothetical protein